MSDSDRMTRRSVLKATGAAAAVGVGSAGPVSAFTEGQCVVLSTEVFQAWLHACPLQGSTDSPPFGDTGTVLNTCWDGETRWVKVEWTPDSVKWVPHCSLDYCRGPAPC